MYPVSPFYAYLLKRYSREFVVKANIAGIEYDNTVIVDFAIDNSLTMSNGFEIGTAIPSKLTITLRTQDTIPPNAKVTPYLGLSSETLTWLETIYPWQDMGYPWSGGLSEWLPLGEFYVDKREQDNNVWTFTCFDKLVFSDVAYISSLTYPTTLQAVWNEICTSLSFAYDESVVIDPSYTVEVGPTGYTKHQMLAYIAGVNGASVYVSKDGTIKFKRFTVDEEPTFEFTTGDYIRVKQTNPVKTYTRVVVTYNPDDGLTYEAGSGDENHTLYTVNPFATQEITNNLLAQFNGFTYLPINMDARGFPQLDQGDVIQFAHNESSTWLETFTAWENTESLWNGEVFYKTIILHQSFSFRGGLRMRIEAPSISEQQSEFAVDGSLTAQVNNLNKVAVRENRNYFGVTITRTEGIIVERDDHASKVVLNSDEMTFYRGTEKAIYFDTINGVYKFNGTLEAADGNFSGTITASTIIGGVITGALIQTAEEGIYPRMQFSLSNIKAEQSATNYALFQPDAFGSSPGFEFHNSSSEGFIYLLGSAFALYTPLGSADIQISSGKDLFLNASNTIRLNGNNLSINGSSGFTGAFLAGSQVVSVSKGIITSVI
ncbi:hypothetical protein [Paenibacillus ginsengarvi]|uniref:Uncharacterized protein n=1 Tax=Paenibacillus ginsengarvi TaxID=400777 RepID=A0A3B0CV22_9BACL|nr:hypothetical protein [Paenibacillus ginsengarvi]RKN86739.1 hypothetical protein D7M11_01925 [Paenibacillus ginsengarvi]